MRTIIIAASAAASMFSFPALAQQPNQGTTSIPDFSGIWGHPYAPGFEPPLSGPGPVTNRSRLPNGVGNVNQLVGDYSNPILKPAAADIVKEHGEISLRGIGYPTPSNQCSPQGVPYIFWNIGMQMLQTPAKITILYFNNHDVRHVPLNQPHLSNVTPSWHGDSVGRYEGDTLVIDTIGVKVGRFSMVDMYGTPHTPALHVIERYRMVDYEAANAALGRGAKENVRLPSEQLPLDVDPNYRGKHLQLQFSVEDEGVFTMPWSATITYRPAFGWRRIAEWPEFVCNENPHEYYSGKDVEAPIAEKLDF